MKKRAKWAAAAAVLMAMTSCGMLNSEQTQAAIEIVNEMAQRGSMTAEQAEALVQALMSNSGEPWWQQILRVAVEVGLAVAGVRIWRGPAAGVAERAARLAAKKS
jgi:hypothetical protein